MTTCNIHPNREAHVCSECLIDACNAHHKIGKDIGAEEERKRILDVLLAMRKNISQELEFNSMNWNLITTAIKRINCI